MAVSLETRVTRVEPIVPTARPSAFSHRAWVFEPKYDGFRGMLYLTGRDCALYSKRGNRMTRFRDLAEQAGRELSCREVVLDGEIVALDQEGRVSFWRLMRGEGTLCYAAFDLLWLNGRDLRTLPLVRRRKRLERLIPATRGLLHRVPCFTGEGLELFEAACRLDLEGIVAKRKADPYTVDAAWYKIKNPAYTQAEGRRELFERGRGARDTAQSIRPA